MLKILTLYRAIHGFWQAKWWFGFRLEPIFTTAPAASKNNAQFKMSNFIQKLSSSFVNLNPWHTLSDWVHLSTVKGRMTKSGNCLGDILGANTPLNHSSPNLLHFSYRVPCLIVCVIFRFCEGKVKNSFVRSRHGVKAGVGKVRPAEAFCLACELVFIKRSLYMSFKIYSDSTHCLNDKMARRVEKFIKTARRRKNCSPPLYERMRGQWFCDGWTGKDRLLYTKTC